MDAIDELVVLEDSHALASNDVDSDEDDVKTPAEILLEFEGVWRNEKFAPEILPHKIDLVECLLDLIKHMEENIENLSHSDFKRSIYQLEVDRVRFLVTSYLRTRIEKIQMYVSHILKQETHRINNGDATYLTESELQFAKEYNENVESHLDSVTSFCPGLPRKEWFNDTIEPNIHSFVFLKSNKDIDGIVIDDGGRDQDLVVDLKEGSQMLMSYFSVSNLVKNGDVNLI